MRAVSRVLPGADVGVVELSGEIDVATVGALRQAVSDHLASGVNLLVVDLSAVTFLDSTGLGVLVGAGKRAAGVGGALRVVVSEPRILRLLTLTGLTLALGVHPTQDAAIADWVAVTA